MAVHEHPRRTAGFYLPSLRRSRAASALGETTSERSVRAYVFASARLLTGFVFPWAFLDKTFGLGDATLSGEGWIDSGSPTEGFLGHVAVGPVQSTSRAWAGAAWADWQFMLGLLGIGVALTTGVALRLAALAGTVMMALIWMAEWPPARRLSTARPACRRIRSPTATSFTPRYSSPWPPHPPATHSASAGCGPGFPSSATGSGCAGRERWDGPAAGSPHRSAEGTTGGVRGPAAPASGTSRARRWKQKDRRGR